MAFDGGRIAAADRPRKTYPIVDAAHSATASAEIAVLAMPSEEPGIWPIGRRRGRPELVAVKGIVASPVGEVLSEAAAHLESEIGTDGHVAFVEQPMEIGAQQQAVGHLMGALLRVGADMSGFERWQGVLVTAHVRP